jgi:hypothetical protein
MKILVLFQVGNLEIAYEILAYIQHLIKNYNLFFIFSLLDCFESQKKDFINNLLIYNITKYYLMFHKNKGMDIGPYLLQLKYVFSTYSIDSFDKILKIHTKTNLKWRNELLDHVLLNLQSSISKELISDLNLSKNKWNLPLDKLNVFHITKICEQFNIQNIFYDELSTVNYNLLKEDDIDIDFYCSYYKIKLSNCDNLSKIMGYDINRHYLYTHLKNNTNIPNESYIIKKTRNPDIHFIAGTIFNISYKTVWIFFSKINLDELYELLESGYITNEKSTYVHAMERILSSVVYF